MLVAAGEVRVGEMDVAELAGEGGVGAHQVHLARPDVAGVEGNVAQTREVVWQVAAPVAPDAEDAAGLPARHVLDGDTHALPTGAFE